MLLYSLLAIQGTNPIRDQSPGNYARGPQLLKGCLIRTMEASQSIFMVTNASSGLRAHVRASDARSDFATLCSNTNKTTTLVPRFDLSV